jgi:hypothetical protein
LYCQPGRVQEYVSKWRTAISRLQSARFPFSIKLSISQFVRGLPSIPAFNTLRANLPGHISAAHDQDYGAFVTLTETALELDTIFRSANHASRPLRSQTTMSSNLASTTPAPLPSKSSTSIPTSSTSTTTTASAQKSCTNCGRTGHWVNTCFEPGGGMEGRRAEYRRDKNKVVAMLLASLEDSYGYEDEDQSATVSTADYTSTTAPDTLDDNVLIHDVVDSVSPHVLAPNQNLLRDVYAMRDSTKPSALATSSEFAHTAYLSLGGKFNSCLDSGCTDYIITNRALFQNYDTAGAVDIGTANCGSLSAKGSGDVTFRVPFEDRYVLFTLRGCLYAPDAPINLISVGALNESRLTVMF